MVASSGLRSLSAWALVGACSLAPTGLSAKVDTVISVSPTVAGEQIADRCVEVRGGLKAWQKVGSFIWAGHLESRRSAVPSLAFRLEEKLPGKSRFEISEPSHRSLRVFNGVSGWKMRIGEDGRPEIKPFTAQEVKFARSAPGLLGPLIDFRAKGTSVELEGTQVVDGRPHYRLGVRLVSGERQTVWIDTETHLETRYDRPVYGPKGALGMVSMRFLDYKAVEGLAVPSLIEISGAAGGQPDRMVIERISLNPPIEDSEFDGLGVPRARAASEPTPTPP